MTTFRDDRRYGEHEAYHRDPGPDFSPEAIAAQTQAFLRNGGKVQVIPTGLSEYKPPSLRPDKVPKGVRAKCGPQIVVGSGRRG